MELCRRCAEPVAECLADIGTMLELSHSAGTARLAADMIARSKTRLDEFAEWSANQRSSQPAATDPEDSDS